MGKARAIGVHVLGWLLFFSLIAAFIFSSPEMAKTSVFLQPAFVVFVAVYTGLFYANTVWLIPRFYLSKNYLLYFSIVVILFAGVSLLKPFDRLITGNATVVAPRREGPPPPPRTEPPPLQKADSPAPERAGPGTQGFDIMSTVLFIAVWAVGFGWQILRQWRITEHRALQAEAGKAAAELSFLKAQINPHFLFNTLNNIYSLATLQSPLTPAAILKLSNMLRYITDEVKADFVPLQQDVDCSLNYIELQKLRLSKKVMVTFLVEGEVAGEKIPPLLFMTFIENAFKYGVSNREECRIEIMIRVVEKEIYFRCSNKIIRSEMEEREGVGINNAKRRLAHLYPGNHSLNIYIQDTLFIVDLQLKT